MLCEVECKFKFKLLKLVMCPGQHCTLRLYTHFDLIEPKSFDFSQFRKLFRNLISHIHSLIFEHTHRKTKFMTGNTEKFVCFWQFYYIHNFQLDELLCVCVLFIAFSLLLWLFPLQFMRKSNKCSMEITCTDANTNYT